jgi:hypothetical protein
MGASTQDDSVVKNESNNIAIEHNIKDVHLEDNKSIEIVFYETNEPTIVFDETNEPTDVFSESFAELFVAALTPFFHPDTDYDDYSAGSIFESANVNMAMDKARRHLTLDPGWDTSNVIIGKVKEPMVQEESFAADADPPMDILPKHEAIDCVLPSLVINLILTAVEMSPAVHGLTLSEHLSRHYAKYMVNTMDRNTKDSTSGKSGAIYEVSSYRNASDTCPIHPNAQVDAYSKPLSRHNAKSMVNMMDQNTKDSTSGKSGAIYEVSSYSNASDTCLIHPNAQVDAYSSAMVVHQPNDGLDNNDLEVAEISDKCCPVNVACAGGQRWCLSVTTGVHIWFDPIIVVARINDLIDQGSTNRTVC